MHRLVSKLRIGEKIGLGFGVVGLVFLLVIWRYQVTLEGVLADYRGLQTVYAEKATQASEIEANLLRANGEANAFLTDRRPIRLQALDAAIERLMGNARRLGAIDAEGRLSGARIAELATTFRARFHNIYRAWETKGLDHDSGLQGAFRDSVHELEALAGHYKVDSLYVYLLQIRRGEKDLGLRRDPEYRQRVLHLLDDFAAKLAASSLEAGVRAALGAELAVYRDAFLTYAEQALTDADIHGGKGPFRESAHRIEDILLAHRVPDMEVRVLQLRRREKDYLLRLEQRYVDMTLHEWEAIGAGVKAADIAEDEKARLLGLLDDYRRDFFALVEQNRLIGQLQEEMDHAGSQLLQLANATAAHANQARVEASADIHREAQRSERLMAWVLLFALTLGLLSAVLITRRITRPLIEMAGFLDRLAFEVPVGRIATVAGSRDEVDAMADSVNRMADHKSRMLAWWKSSLEELEAERDRLAARGRGVEGSAGADAEAAAAVRAWEAASEKRTQMLRASHAEMQREALRIEEEAARLGKGGQAISTAAREILSRLDILLRKR